MVAESDGEQQSGGLQLSKTLNKLIESQNVTESELKAIGDSCGNFSLSLLIHQIEVI